MNTLCTVVNRSNVETLCLSKPPQKTENLFINFVHTETVRNKRRSERKLRRKVHLRFRKKKVAVKIVYSAEWSNSRFATMSQNVWLAYVVRLRSCKLSIEAGKKVKFSHTRYRALGPELIPVYRQSARRWREVNHAIYPAVVCHCFLPGLRLPS